jgi:hypothetical protein
MPRAPSEEQKQIEVVMPTSKKASKTRDLPPKKSGAVKGGKLSANQNLTLVHIR